MGNFAGTITGTNNIFLEKEKPCSISIVDYTTGEQVKNFKAEGKICDISPEGNRYIRYYLNELSVCDMHNGNQLYTVDADFGNTFAPKFQAFFSPDGNKIAVIYKANVSVFYAPQIMLAESETFKIVAPEPSVKDLVIKSKLYIEQSISKPLNLLENRTDYPVKIENIEVINQNANNEFSLNTVFQPFTIPPHSSHKVEFKFKPQKSGEREAEVIVETPTKRFSSKIRGYAEKRDIFLQDDNYYFGNVKPLTEKDTTITFFRNTSGELMEVANIKIIGPDKRQFSLDLNSGKNKTLDIKVKFAPQKAGETNCLFKIEFVGGENFELMLSENGDAPRIVSLYGKVTDKATGKGIETAITCYDWRTDVKLQTTSSENGEYSLTLPVGRDYVLIADTTDYMPGSDRIYLSGLVLDSIYHSHIELAKIEQNATSIIHSINFKSSDDKLTKDIIVELDHFVEKLKDYPNMQIEISGHTDNRGSDQSNNSLSRKRAISVKKYFEQNRINSNRLTTKGYGSTKPIGDNNTEKGREKNRRVEIKITKM